MTLNLNLNLPKGLSLSSTLQHWLLVVHGEELTLISCTKNSDGKFFITRDGIYVSVTFITFEITRDLYTYTLRYHRNVLFIIICADLTYTSTNRFSHTYFQNCMREWNQSDESIKSSPTISVFKRELIRLIRPQKRSLFGFHGIEGVRLLTRLRVEFSDLREHRFRHNFQCSSPMCFCQTGIENNEYFLLHCPCHSSHHRDLLDRTSNVVDVDPENLSSTDLCNLFLMAIPASRLILTITSLNQ